MIEEADLIITALPEQKKDLAGLYPKAAAKTFAMREISQWEGPRFIFYVRGEKIQI